MTWINYAATVVAIIAGGVAGACLYAIWLEWRQ